MNAELEPAHVVSARDGSQAEARRDNEWLALQLAEVAELLEAQGANPFRVRAYRRAASTLAGLARPLGELLLERHGIAVSA